MKRQAQNKLQDKEDAILHALSLLGRLDDVAGALYRLDYDSGKAVFDASQELDRALHAALDEVIKARIESEPYEYAKRCAMDSLIARRDLTSDHDWHPNNPLNK